MNEVVQGTGEWLAQRVGKLTASRIADATARTKTGWGASRANYMAELIAERLTGNPAEQYTNSAMQWGQETEAQARAAYVFTFDVDVIAVGFVPHPKIGMSGASPDGLVGDNGLVEFKCPNTATHIDTLLGAEIDGRYVKQMQWQMACAGRQWCDWVSFDPRLPDEMQMFTRRVQRDDKMIAELEAQAADFLAEVEQKVAALKSRYGRKEAA